MKDKKVIPAIPPKDYKGSQADWMIALVERGLWDDSDGSWYGDVMIPELVYWEILEECEGEEDDEIQCICGNAVDKQGQMCFKCKKEL